MSERTKIHVVRRSDRMAKAGFTLLEVVLAIAITMVLGAAVLVFYHYTLRTRETLLHELEQISTTRMVMDRLTLELRTVVQGPGLGPVVTGTPNSIEFMITSLPEPEAWQSDDMGRTVATSDLRIVSYRLGSVTELREAEGVGLRRAERRHTRDSLVDLSRDWRVLHVTDQIQFMQFRYFDGLTWLSNWDRVELPRGVEVTLGGLPLPVDMKPEAYPYPLFRRVVALPTASRHNVSPPSFNRVIIDAVEATP